MTQPGGATIAEGARFDGTYKGGDLTVLGSFDGTLELRGRLRLGPEGRAKGKVKAAAVEIEGEFDGEVRAEALAFGAASRATGVFLAPRLSMREGARVDGALNVESARSATPAQPADAKGKAARPKGSSPSGGDTVPEAAPAVSAGEAAAMSA